MVPLLQELGLDARWDVVKGGEDFYAVTKSFITLCTAIPQP
jgi:trehalose synthase